PLVFIRSSLLSLHSLLYHACTHSSLLSFPTRRSSDLVGPHILPYAAPILFRMTIEIFGTVDCASARFHTIILGGIFSFSASLDTRKPGMSCKKISGIL